MFEQEIKYKATNNKYLHWSQIRRSNCRKVD